VVILLQLISDVFLVPVHNTLLIRRNNAKTAQMELLAAQVTCEEIMAHTGEERGIR